MDRRMDRRKRNIEIFKDTIDLCKNSERLKQIILECRAAQKMFREGAALPGALGAAESQELADVSGVSENPDLADVSGTPEIIAGMRRRYDASAAVIVSGKRTLEAASAYAHAGKKTCILNFASATHPGGGVVSGSSAQEECLCRCSTLYFSLDIPEMKRCFYRPHIEAEDSLYNDDCIYTLGVLAVKSDIDFPERLPESEWYPVNVITCAAPNLRGVPASFVTTEKLRPLFESRIRRIFEVAAWGQNEVLILGAFGCGAFCNPPELVAEVFHTVMQEYLHTFETIEYAVFHKEWETANYEAFARWMK